MAASPISPHLQPVGQSVQIGGETWYQPDEMRTYYLAPGTVAPHAEPAQHEVKRAQPRLRHTKERVRQCQ